MRFFEGHPKTIEMSEDMSMNIDPEFVYPTPLAKVKPATEKNAHLKGRKRFNADLHDMKEECTGGIVQHGFRIKSRFKGGRSNIGSTICLTFSQQTYVLAMMRVRSRSSYVTIAGSILLTFLFLVGAMTHTLSAWD